MKAIVASLMLLAAPFLLLGQQEVRRDQDQVAFTHVTVIDATGSPERTNMTVLITGNRISDLGKTGTVVVPKNAKVIDGTGKFLIPGLWDMHTHPFYDIRGEKEKFSPEPALKMFLANGVTGIRDMFGPLEEVNRWREKITQGSIIGPHIFAAGSMVDGPQPVWPGAIGAGTVAEGKKAVDTLKQSGSDFIKVYSLLPRDVYLSIALEAQTQRIPFVGHTPDSVSVFEASNAGQNSIEHLEGVLLTCSSRELELRLARMEAMSTAEPVVNDIKTRNAQIPALVSTYDEQKCRLLSNVLAKNRTWQVPTLVLNRTELLGDNRFPYEAVVKYYPPSMRKSLADFHSEEPSKAASSDGAKLFKLEETVVGQMSRLGVPIMAGTDAHWQALTYFGFSLHQELILLVESGLTPMQALQSATRNPAEFLGLLDSMGTIEKGKIADLVLLEANPLKNIANTEKIFAVVVGGRLIDASGRKAILASVEKAASTD